MAPERFDIALEPTIEPIEFAVSPKAELVAVGVQQVGQGLQLFPLFLVVPSLVNRRGSAPLPGALISTKPTSTLRTVMA